MMMLESMIAAYTMSTMSVDGTRPSEPSLGEKSGMKGHVFEQHELVDACFSTW